LLIPRKARPESLGTWDATTDVTAITEDVHARNDNVEKHVIFNIENVAETLKI
jgi:hypothetical protein